MVLSFGFGCIEQGSNIKGHEAMGHLHYVCMRVVQSKDKEAMHSEHGHA